MIPVPDITLGDQAYGTMRFLPAMEDIPEEFRERRTPWEDIAAAMFFKGTNPEWSFYPKEGVDAEKALKAIGAILMSYGPKHEHKMAGVAYLLSQWFEKVEMPEK